jgi:hypothetical protein
VALPTSRVLCLPQEYSLLCSTSRNWSLLGVSDSIPHTHVQFFSCDVLVLALYSQGGGKSGIHSWQGITRNLGAISYISAQLYEQSFNSLFRAVHKELAHLQGFTFDHFTTDSFLRRLPGSQNISPDLRTLQLDNVAYAAYSELLLHLPKLLLVLRDLQRKRKQANSKAKTSQADS